MTQAGYNQFCPVAMAAEILCTRWTMLVVRELTAGSTRFNDLQRGVPRMSRTLLAKRLRELESWGIVDRQPLRGDPHVYEYRMTQAGLDLLPVVHAMGTWGQKWVESKVTLDNLDPSLLMWDMRRNLDPEPLPARRTVVQFRFHDQPQSKQLAWLVVEPDGDVDLCWSDPGFEVDLYVTTDLRTLTAIWMGIETVQGALERIEFDGSRTLAGTMQKWLGLSPFASQKKLAS